MQTTPRVALSSFASTRFSAVQVNTPCAIARSERPMVGELRGLPWPEARCMADPAAKILPRFAGVVRNDIKGRAT